jgi:hypothetical protein
MIRVTPGSRRARSVRSVLVSLCALLVLAGMMVAAALVSGLSPARAQFGAGLPLGFGKPTGVRWRRRYRYRPYYRGRRGPRDDGSDTDVEQGGATTGPAGEPGRRPSAAPNQSRPASPSRPQRRGLDTDPEK